MARARRLPQVRGGTPPSTIGLGGDDLELPADLCFRQEDAKEARSPPPHLHDKVMAMKPQGRGGSRRQSEVDALDLRARPKRLHRGAARHVERIPNRRSARSMAGRAHVRKAVPAVGRGDEHLDLRKNTGSRGRIALAPRDDDAIATTAAAAPPRGVIIGARADQLPAAGSNATTLPSRPVIPPTRPPIA